MTTRKQSKYGRMFILKTRASITIYTYKRMFYSWLMLLKKFRGMCLNQYGLDPVFWYTVPNFAFDAMLKLTGIKLDLVFDQEMYEMIEAGLRGGMTQTIPARK